jgi:2-haloacid dehalogenase
VTLTNGSANLATETFAGPGVPDLLERRLSVSEPRRWKPASAAYRFGATACGVPIEQTALVAVHPWDIDGGEPRRDDHGMDRSPEDPVSRHVPPRGRDR